MAKRRAASLALLVKRSADSIEVPEAEIAECSAFAEFEHADKAASATSEAGAEVLVNFSAYVLTQE